MRLAMRQPHLPDNRPSRAEVNLAKLLLHAVLMSLLVFAVMSLWIVLATRDVVLALEAGGLTGASAIPFASLALLLAARQRYER